ncbi:MAG: hypothetical protein V4615_16395 [Bacteroidota bacterium]
MATRPWIFLMNTFFTNTVESIKNALSLTNDHLAKLTANEADAEILAIKTIYLPLHTAFITAYNHLDAKLGIYHGKTVTFEEMLEELAKEKINEWRGQVFAIFPEQTANAQAIFPQDRQPFQSGTYDQRVEAVSALSERLGTYTAQPTLVTLSIAVLAYYTTLTGARALQQTDEGSVATLRTNLKTMHRILCNGLYRNLGKLMAKYAETPLTVADYYNLSLLRDTGDEEEILNGTIPANTVIAPIDYQSSGFNFPSTTVVRLKNTSTNGSNLIFYPSNTQDGLPGAGTEYFLNAGQTLDKTFAELGSEGFLFLCIYNQNAMAASWEIEILE